MKNLFLNPASLMAVFITMLLSACGTNNATSNPVASDSSASSAAKRDTTMPHESVQSVVAAADSVTPNAQNATKDSVGSKISVRHGEVKVVDTTKKDR